MIVVDENDEDAAKACIRDSGLKVVNSAFGGSVEKLAVMDQVLPSVMERACRRTSCVIRCLPEFIGRARSSFVMQPPFSLPRDSI